LLLISHIFNKLHKKYKQEEDILTSEVPLIVVALQETKISYLSLNSGYKNEKM
jgi:hypothetical protein